MPGLDAAGLLAAWERGLGEPVLRRGLTILAVATGAQEAELAELDVGSRDALLAALLPPGPDGLTWTCTSCAGCQEELDVPVDIAELARLPVHPPGRRFEASVQDDVLESLTVSFRLPTTADLEAVEGLDPERAEQDLLRTCLGCADTEVPDAVVEAVNASMDQVSPAAAVRVGARCADCGTVSTAALDVAVLLWADVEVRALAVLAEVHALSSAYGWSQSEVLALSPRCRAAYLEMVGA